MAAIQGQPAPKPSSLARPVPGEEQKQSLQESLNVKLPPVDMGQAPAQGDQADQLLAQFDQADQLLAQFDQAEVAPQGQDFPVEERSSFLGIDTNLRQQLEEMPTRIAAGIAGDPASVKLTLEKKFGADNVRMKDNEFYYKKPGSDKFTKLDPGTFEIVNDIFSDNYRMALSALTAGGAATIAAPSGPAGMTAAGVLGYAAGSQAVDVLGQERYGVVKSPEVMNQKVAQENAMRPQGEFTPEWLKAPPAGSVGEEIQRARIAFQEKISEGIEFEAMNKLFGAAIGKIGDTIASRRLAQEAKNKASVTTQEVLNTANAVKESAENLAAAGINLKQGKVVLSPGQVAGDLAPEAQMLDASLSKEAKVRDFFYEQGKLVAQGWEKLQQGIVNIVGKSPSDIFQSVKGASKMSKDIEGKTIGVFRDQAINLSKGEAWPMMRTNQMTAPFYGELGFSYGKDGKLLKPSMERLQEMFPDANSATLGKLSTLVGELETKMTKGKGSMSLADTNAIYGRFRDTIDSWWGTQSGGKIAEYLVPIKNALRDDFAEQAGEVLKKVRPEAVENYKAAMQKFSDIIGAQETLKRVLKQKDLSAASFADYIFSPSHGKERIGQLKVLINDTDSTLWPQLVNQQLTLMRDRATDTAGRTNWAKFSGEMAKLDQYGVLDQMVNVKDKALLKDFFNIAKHVDTTFRFSEKEIVNPGMVTGVKNVIQKAMALKNGKEVAADVIAGIGKDKALVQWLEGEGLALVLKDMPKAQKIEAQGVINAAIAKSKEYVKARIPEAIRRPEMIPSAMMMPQEGSMSGQIKEVRKGTPVGP